MTKEEDLFFQEMRGTCNCPKEWQFLDFGGAIFGIFFILDAFRKKKLGTSDNWTLAELLLGTIMATLHTSKFFCGKEMGMMKPKKVTKEKKKGGK